MYEEHVIFFMVYGLQCQLLTLKKYDFLQKLRMRSFSHLHGGRKQDVLIFHWLLSRHSL